MTLLFHAQYLDQSGKPVREHAVFADDLARAYELAIARAHLAVDPISAVWVTIKEDPSMFKKVLKGDTAIDYWESPFKPTPVFLIPQRELDVNGRVLPPHVMP